jgi:acetate kinase
MRVLVLNPGSSSLKATVLEPPGRTALVATTVDWGDDATVATSRSSAVSAVLEQVGSAGIDRDSIGGVGYRVVHGGARFRDPTLIDDPTVQAIEDLADLAPLHNRIAAETIRACRAALPSIGHVAAFDTGFHATLTPAGYRYPVPESWFRDWGVRRFGFHGLSVSWAIRRTAELLGRHTGDLRVVVAHLGSGCSVTAVDGGRSIDTSMGMTPLEGLMMGTRAGSIDPGVLLALLRDGRLGLPELTEGLDHRSGLLGVSGRSADVRDLLAAEAEGDAAAALALELFVRRAAAGIAAAATCLPALDAVVFTGGIGQNASALRTRIAARLGLLGIAVVAGTDPAEDAIVSAPGAVPAVLRIGAREDVVIAEAVRTVLERPAHLPLGRRPSSG